MMSLKCKLEIQYITGFHLNGIAHKYQPQCTKPQHKNSARIHLKAPNFQKTNNTYTPIIIIPYYIYTYNKTECKNIITFNNQLNQHICAVYI